MNHPTEDQILLLAYGELPDADARHIEAHVTGCAACSAAFDRIERARVAVDLGLPQSKTRLRWVVAALAAAAVLATVLLLRPTSPQPPEDRWRPMSVWSSTAGYVAGGTAMVEIDAQLTRLEQERDYGWPN
jgi:anti-sigma factor RsiW